MARSCGVAVAEPGAGPAVLSDVIEEGFVQANWLEAFYDH